MFVSLFAFIYNTVNLFKSNISLLLLFFFSFVPFLWPSRLGGKTDVGFQRVCASVSHVAAPTVIVNEAKILICWEI